MKHFNHQLELTGTATPQPRLVKKVDTSLLLADLCEKYKSFSSPVPIDFKEVVKWVPLGDQLTHQIHPYPAKLLPSIANFFLSATTIIPKNAAILDPFCGSGTVALEATLRGHQALVADANPLARMITKVKTTPYRPVDLLEALQKIVAKAGRFKSAPHIEIVNAELWYSRRRKSELEILHRAITEVATDEVRDFFWVCFSILIRKLSLADPAISVPVLLKEKETRSKDANAAIRKRLQWIRNANTLLEFEKLCVGNIARVHETNLINPKRTPAVEVGADARRLVDQSTKSLQMAGDSVDVAFTSPPYGSAQKYIRACGLSLNWLGMADPTQLKVLESKSIGREHVPAYRGGAHNKLLDEFELVVKDIEVVDRTRATITRTYLSDLQDAMEELFRVLSPAGRLIVIVGNNQVSGRELKNDVFIRQVLERKGAITELELADTIKTRGLMRKRNSTAAVISRESVLMFKKKG